MKKFIENETAIKIKMCCGVEKLNQRHNRAKKVKDFRGDCIVVSEEQDQTTQFLQRYWVIDIQEQVERYCILLPVFGFESAKYVLILFRSYLLPILVNERDMESTVIKNDNYFVSLKIGEIQVFALMNFLYGATNPYSSLKA